jgi:surface carbohydrate biosynthesis protein
MKLKEMFFKKIFFKIQFYPPSKKKILIYDAGGIEYFDKLFFKKDYEIFHNRYEKINFFILAKVFIKSGLSNIKKNYKYYYISYVSPKVIITFVDNNPGFYLIKEKFPEIIFISIQNGIRNNIDFLDLKKKVKKNKRLAD